MREKEEPLPPSGKLSGKCLGSHESPLPRLQVSDCHFTQNQGVPVPELGPGLHSGLQGDLGWTYSRNHQFGVLSLDPQKVNILGHLLSM